MIKKKKSFKIFAILLGVTVVHNIPLFDIQLTGRREFFQDVRLNWERGWARHNSKS